MLSDDGRFHYLGGTLPLPSPLGMRAIKLGRRAVEAMPGLRGYVGVDLVLGDAADGSGDFAIEINPRLTTSYLGLRMLAQDNLAAAMLRVTLGHDIGKLRWRQEVIRFGVVGSLETWPQ
jgi:predicted ATP-grasp superfamily ATP-dependent carboligase